MPVLVDIHEFALLHCDVASFLTIVAATLVAIVLRSEQLEFQSCSAYARPEGISLPHLCGQGLRIEFIARMALMATHDDEMPRQ